MVDRLVIAGTPDQVVDGLLGFRDVIGRLRDAPVLRDRLGRPGARPALDGAHGDRGAAGAQRAARLSQRRRAAPVVALAAAVAAAPVAGRRGCGRGGRRLRGRAARGRGGRGGAAAGRAPGPVSVEVVGGDVDVDVDDSEVVVVRRMLGFVVEAGPLRRRDRLGLHGRGRRHDHRLRRGGGRGRSGGRRRRGGRGGGRGRGGRRPARRRLPAHAVDAAVMRGLVRAARGRRRRGRGIGNETGVAAIAGAAGRRAGAGAWWASRARSSSPSVASPPLVPGAKPGQEPVKTTSPVSTAPSATASALSARAVPAPSASSRRMRGVVARSREGNSTTS